MSLRDHLGRNASLITVGLLLAGSAPVIVNSVAAATPAKAVLLIEGTNTFVRNQSTSSTYHFAKQPLHVKHGQEVLIRNETTDGHTIALVSARDLPGNFGQMNQCENSGVCNDINSMYFPPGAQSPAGVQIDNGKLTDDSDTDADTPDPAVPPNAPFTAYVEDFDTASHSNPGGPSTIGDSTLIGPKGGPQGPDQRNIVITAAPGTYHFFCTFHPWMQGTLIVS